MTLKRVLERKWNNRCIKSNRWMKHDRNPITNETRQETINHPQLSINVSDRFNTTVAYLQWTNVFLVMLFSWAKTVRCLFATIATRGSGWAAFLTLYFTFYCFINWLRLNIWLPLILFVLVLSCFPPVRFNTAFIYRSIFSTDRIPSGLHLCNPAGLIKLRLVATALIAKVQLQSLE